MPVQCYTPQNSNPSQSRFNSHIRFLVTLTFPILAPISPSHIINYCTYPFQTNNAWLHMVVLTLIFIFHSLLSFFSNGRPYHQQIPHSNSYYIIIYTTQVKLLDLTYFYQLCLMSLAASVHVYTRDSFLSSFHPKVSNVLVLTPVYFFIQFFICCFIRIL